MLKNIKLDISKVLFIRAVRSFVLEIICQGPSCSKGNLQWSWVKVSFGGGGGGGVLFVLFVNFTSNFLRKNTVLNLSSVWTLKIFPCIFIVLFWILILDLLLIFINMSYCRSLLHFEMVCDKNVMVYKMVYITRWYNLHESVQIKELRRSHDRHDG